MSTINTEQRMEARQPMPVASPGKSGAATVPGGSRVFPRRSAISHFQRAVTLVEAAADALAVVAAVMMAYLLYRMLGLGVQVEYPISWLLGTAAICASLVVLMLDRTGAYRPGNSLLRVKETERVLRVCFHLFVLVLMTAVFASFYISRWVLALAALLLPLSLILEKHGIYAWMRALHARGYGVERVGIYGAGATGRRIFSALSRSPKLGMSPVLLVDDDPSHTGSRVYENSYDRSRSIEVAAGPLTPELLLAHGVRRLIIGIPSISRGKFLEITAAAESANVTVSFVPQHYAPSEYSITYADLDGIMLASFAPQLELRLYTILKRPFDFLVAVLLLILTSPLMLLVVLAIRLSSGGPAWFVQQRVGHDGKLFNLYKFRTMHAETDAYSVSPVSAEDPRITPIGRFLRRTSLDELPQLLNVLRGDMSLVGPRPEMPFIVERYTTFERQRLQVKPGLTGLWQLSADRAFMIHENIEYDLYYIRNRNFFMDLAILLHTAVFAARGI